MRKYLTVTYNKATKLLEIDSDGLFIRKSMGSIHVSIDANDVASRYSEIEAAKRSKGIIILSNAYGIRILNDPFCTIPLYYTETKTHLYASSDPQKLIDYRSHRYDSIGLWETLLLNSPIWNRTPFKDIKFLPAACQLKVSAEVKLERYWSFEFEPTNLNFNSQNFFFDLDDLINQKFANINADSLLMGLSGGNDSRLAAHYLSRNKNRFSDIKFVTYAASSKSYEFRYACDVAHALDLKQPHLHLLKEQHYLDALDYLPQWSAGQINNLHCHLVSYLRGGDLPIGNMTLLSTYYTDALFGYACGKSDSLSQIDHCSAYQIIKSSPHVPSSVRSEIIDDLQNALINARPNQSCFSSLDEVKYVVERNPRFHMSLAFIQHQFIPTISPFADFDLLQMTMLAPISLREGKTILSKLLGHINPRLNGIGSSANTEYFYGVKSRLRNGTLLERIEFLKFRFLNMTRQLLARLSGGRVSIPNAYQTEDQVSVYRKAFHNLVPMVIANHELRKCLGDEGVNHIFKDCVFLRNIEQRVSLICFNRLSERET